MFTTTKDSQECGIIGQMRTFCLGAV